MTLPVSHRSSSGVGVGVGVGVRRNSSNRIVVGRSHTNNSTYNLPDRNVILNESGERDRNGSHRPDNDLYDTLSPPPPSNVGNDDDDDDDPYYRETVRVRDFRDWTNSSNNKLDLSDAAVTRKYAESALPTPLAGNKSKSKCARDDHDEDQDQSSSSTGLLWGENDNLESEQRRSSVVDNFLEDDGSVLFTSDDYVGKKNYRDGDDDTTITPLFDDDKIGAFFNPDSPLNAQDNKPSSSQQQQHQQQQQQEVSIKKSKNIELTADETIMEQIVAAATNAKEDEASVTSSIVSSLSDTISYQRLSMGRFRGRSRRSGRSTNKKGYTKVGDPNGNFNGNTNSSHNSRTKDKHNKDKDKNKSSSSNSKPASSMSVMATLMFKRGGLRKGFSTRSRAMAPPITPPPSDTNNNHHHHVHRHLHDTVTTAATGESLGCHTLETIDKSLEHNLFQQGSQRRLLGVGMMGGSVPSSLGAQSWSRSSPGTKGPSVDTPSPLGAEIDREEHRYLMMEAHRRRMGVVKKGRPSPNLPSPGWSSTQSSSHVNGSLKGGPGDGISSRPASGAQQNVPQEWTVRDERWSSPRRNLHCTSPKDERSREDNNQLHHHRSTSLTSNCSEFGNNNASTGIKTSWLVPSPPRVQQPSFGGEPKPQTERASTPASGESLIDVTHDEPIDPFSGLIGMPSSIGCERSIVSGDGESYTGMNVFGTRIGSSSSLNLMETPGATTLTSAKTATYDEFDPLMEDEILKSPSPHLMINNYYPTSVSSAGIPPRHYKDDPLLSRSRYRSPLQMKKNPSSRHRRSTSAGGVMNPSSRHRRSASAGGGMGSHRSDMMMENTCMFGCIVLSETTKTPMTPLGDMMPQNLNSASLEWDGSVSPNSPSTAQSISHSLAIPGSDAKNKKQAFMTPNNNQDMGSTANNTLDRDREGDGDDDDNSSFQSFSEEYHRAEQKRKVVAKEMKHIIGKVLPIPMKPVVKVGRKLLGREKEGGMKRSEGCLT